MATASADAQAAAARVNQEELFHELEQKYLLLKADFAVLESERDAVVEQKTSTATQVKQLQTAVEERDAEVVKAKEELLKLRTERDQLTFQVRAATSQAERRLNDVEELQRTVKEQNKQLIESQRKEVEALQKAAEQDALVEPLRHSVNRVNSKLESTKQHLEWTEKQLAEKTKMLQELRQSSTKIAHDHEDLKTRHAEEMASLRKQLESARQTSKKLESSLVQASEQLKEGQAARVHEEERLHNELSAQRRLADLYKDSAEDANIRVQELQELCEKLRHSLAESEDALAHQEERTKKQVEHFFREQAEASERRIEALQDELKESQERLKELQKNKLFSLQTASAVSELSSAAGAAHLAAHGLTPKELCDQILALETALRAERDEKEQLHVCMNRVVKEVHEKAPMIMGLKLDLERSVASHAQVSERLEACMQDLVKCRTREHQASKDKQASERKSEALAKSVDDLSRQVQHLLFRSHESSQSSHAIGESASENLVVFKNVEELQIRNQQLLMVIREMAEEKKSHRRSGADMSGSYETTHLISGESDGDNDSDAEPASSVNKRLSMALKEIEELRSEREDERKMITSIVHQRDMYRVLLAQTDSKYSGMSVEPVATAASSEAAAGTQHNHRASVEITETRALRELQKEFDTYKKEKQTDMKTLQSALEQARSESSAFRLAEMQAGVEAKCHKDRYEVAERRRQDAEDEIARLRAKSDQLNTLLIQHQKLLSETDAKLETAVTKLRALEVERDGAIREVAFMKKNEDTILREISTLRLDNTNLLKLMDTSRQIESSREERERRDSDRMAQKVVALESKLQEAHDKIESNEAVAGAKLSVEEQARKIVTTELAAAKENLATTREQLARLEEQITAATSKSTLHEKEVMHLREQLRKGASAAAAERVSALEVQLRQSQLEVQSAVEMKKSLTEAVSKYKAIAEANEKSLSELSSASEKWKLEQQQAMQAIQSERDALRAELDKARSQIRDDVSEGNKLREEMDKMTLSHQAALQQSLTKQRQLQIDADSARAELSALQQEVSSLREDVSTAQENYERELKLHASQVEKYSASRKLVQEEQQKNRELLSEVGELKAKVAIAEKEAADNVASIEKLLQDANQSKSSLVEQNKLLHTQLERANNQLRRAHETEMLRSIGETAPSTGEAGPASREHAKELDDLRSVIAYLRKESEILSSKHELAHQENQRFRTQVSTLEATIERLREELKRVEESTLATTSTVTTSTSVPGAAKQAAQLEQFDLLRESNATLREECQKNLARLRAEEERVKNLEAQLAPLRSSEALLKAQIDSSKQDIVALTDANKRWKLRVEQLVEKYQQIDPAEHEKVCAEKAAALKELSEVKAKETALRAEIETLKSSEGKNAEEEKGKTENLRKQYDRIKGFAKTWKTKAEALGKQVTDKTKEAEEKAALLVEFEKKLGQSLSDKRVLEAKIASLESSKSDNVAGAAAAAVASAAWEKERQELAGKVENETKRFNQLKEMNAKLLSGMKQLRQENSQLKDQLSSSAITQPTPASTPSTTSTTSTASIASTVSTTNVAAPPQPPANEVAKPTPPMAQATVAVPNATKSTSVDAKSTPEPAVPVPAKSPFRAPAPTQPPATIPTLKTVGVPAPAVTSQPIAKPITTAVVAAVPSPAKAESKEATPVPVPTVAPAANVPASTAPAAPSQPSAEEKLRLFALQSMKKQFQKVGDSTAKPPVGSVTATPTKPSAAASVAPAAAPKPPVEEVKSTHPPASGPFISLAPATSGFGAIFGGGGASGLVFGKPGITLPIPASPTPVPALATAAGSSTFGAAPVVPPTADAAPATAGTGETEAQRRSQRLARFGVLAAEADAALALPGSKRPATDEPEASTATPQKMAKTEQTGASAASIFDSQDTEDEQVVENSEATEDEAAAAPSPATQSE